MSVETRREFPRIAVNAATSFRGWAVASAAVLTLTYLSVLVHVVDVADGTIGISVFVLEVFVTFILAAVFSRIFPVRYAIVIGVALLTVGLLKYLTSIPAALIDTERQVANAIALLTGVSVLRIAEVGTWTLSFTPAPVFASWYFFLRRKYTLGTLVGGMVLSFFILTGDIDMVLGLVGAVGAVGVVGFGRLDHEGGSIAQRNTLMVVIVAMIVVTTSISLIPGGETRPLLPDRGPTTVEGSLINGGERVPVIGSTNLSPEARFTVTAEQRDYWRVAAFDRYTRHGWIRTGEKAEYSEELSPPPGDAERIQQTFRAESSVAVMPAAWKPVRVERGADQVEVTSTGDLQPAGSLRAGESYTVESLRPQATAQDLRAVKTDYPDRIEERYLQLPESTPDRVGEFTSRITAGADNPYEVATTIERWLERNKAYSLDVRRPDGDIAAGFLFEMDAGYCTYFATTMVVMLRSQGIPARFVVGYTPGEQVAQDKWVVRGLDSHAWVEVYFPGEGWIRFDPTPASPRFNAERNRLQEARQTGEQSVETNLSAGNFSTPSSRALRPLREVSGRGAVGLEQGETNETTPTTGLLFDSADPAREAGDNRPPPTRQTMLYGTILLAGIVAVIQRTGLHNRVYRAIWLRSSPSGTPRERIEGSYVRLEYLLSRRYRERRADETSREYINALSIRGVDEKALRLYRLYERARYAGAATEGEAEMAEDLLRDLR